jgi:hypothetical protein
MDHQEASLMAKSNAPTSPTPLQLPGLDAPVRCVSCLQTVADLHDPDLEQQLLAHRCLADQSRWTR